MAGERCRHAAFSQVDVVGLPHIVEAEHLHHDMMDAAVAGLDESKAVMARIDVQETRLERWMIIGGQSEAEKVAVKRQQLVDRLNPLDVEDDMTEAERTSAEARHRAAW